MTPSFWEKKNVTTLLKFKGTLEKEEDNNWCQLESETKRKTEVKME